MHPWPAAHGSGTKGQQLLKGRWYQTRLLKVSTKTCHACLLNTFNVPALLPGKFQAPHHDLHCDPCTDLPAWAEPVSFPSTRGFLSTTGHLLLLFVQLANFDSHQITSFDLFPLKPQCQVGSRCFCFWAPFFSFLLPNYLCNSVAGKVCLIVHSTLILVYSPWCTVGMGLIFSERMNGYRAAQSNLVFLGCSVKKSTSQSSAETFNVCLPGHTNAIQGDLCPRGSTKETLACKKVLDPRKLFSKA